MDMRSIVKIVLFFTGTLAVEMALLDTFPKLIPLIGRFIRNGEYDKLLPTILWVGTWLFGVICLWVLGVTL